MTPIAAKPASPACSVQVRNASSKCFIWIVAWLCVSACCLSLNVNASSPSAPIQASSTHSSLLNRSTSATTNSSQLIAASPSTCSVNEFECRTDHLCVPVSRVADGIRDCPDGSDECDNESQFRCKCGNPVCIDRILVMDGQLHCEDGSDEGLDDMSSACISNELSVGFLSADYPGENVKQNSNKVLDTGQSIVVDAQLSSSQDANFVEFTGTFLPFNEIAATNLEAYQFYTVSPSKSSDHRAVIEITGTFFPEELSTGQQELVKASKVQSEISLPSIEIESSTVLSLNKAEDNQLKLIRGTNQTFVIDGQKIMLMTGTCKNITSDLSNAFVFACVHAAVNSSNTCLRNLPVEVQIEQVEARANDNVVAVSVMRDKVVARISRLSKSKPDNEGYKSRVQSADASFEAGVVSGVVIHDANNIEVNKENHLVPISVKDHIQFEMMLNRDRPVHFTVIQNLGKEKNNLKNDTETSVGLELPAESILPSMSHLNIVSSISTKPMITKTVGNLNEHYFIDDSMSNSKSLESFFLNRSIPIYRPTKIEASTMTSKLVSSMNVPLILNTSTIFGFIDFTTVVNNTLLIFTPKMNADSGASKNTKIEPSKAAIFKNFPSTSKKASTSSRADMNLPDQTATFEPSISSSFYPWSYLSSSKDPSEPTLSSTISSSQSTMPSSDLNPTPEFLSTSSTSGYSWSYSTTSSQYSSTSSDIVEPALLSERLEPSISIEYDNTELISVAPETAIQPLLDDDMENSKSISEISSALPTPPLVGITITSGFILPSFPEEKTTVYTHSPTLDSSNLMETVELSSSVASSSSALAGDQLIPTTYYTRFTEYVTESQDGTIITKSNKLTSTSLAYNSLEESVRPTKPLKTYFTTYTYYTTFKNNETEFVHSRKEVVTNIVDLEEDNIIEPTNSVQDGTKMSTSSVESILNLLSTSLGVNENDITPTPSLVDIQLSTNVASTGLDNQLSNLQTEPLNKSYLGKLLSGIAVPITHYTTFTYYTTFFKDLSSQIVSRTKVISNVVTGTINLNQGIQKRSTDYRDILPEGAENYPIIITPVTEYATSTYYTTFFVPGQGSTVVTNTQLFSKVFLPEYSPTRIKATQSSTHNTSVGRLTQTSLVTRLINGVPILENGDFAEIGHDKRLSSSFALLRNQVNKTSTNSDDSDVELLSSSATRRRVVVTKTKTLRNGHSLDGINRKSIVVVRGPPQSSLVSSHISSPHDADSHFHEVGRLHPSVTPTPVTYYTTYTYFTTQLVDGKPVVRSNEHLYSTVITDKILPTRVVPTIHQRIRRSVAAEQSLNESAADTNETDSDEISDNKIENKAIPKFVGKPTGIISEFSNKRGFQTIVTQIIGTVINGFYAQFAVTKTIEPKMMLSTIDHIDSNNLPEDVTTQTNKIHYGETQPSNYSTEKTNSVKKSPITNEGVTTETELLESDSNQLKNETSTDSGDSFLYLSKAKMTFSALNSSVSGTPIIKLDPVPVTDSSTSTANLINTNTMLASSMNDAVYMPDTPTQVSALSTAPTSDQSTSSSKTIEIDYRTGLISSTVESITGNNIITRITKEVFGTYIGGIYAHLAKTRSDTIGLIIQTQTSTTNATSIELKSNWLPVEATSSLSITPSSTIQSNTFTSTSTFTTPQTEPKLSLDTSTPLTLSLETQTNTNNVTSNPKYTELTLPNSSSTLSDITPVFISATTIFSSPVQPESSISTDTSSLASLSPTSNITSNHIILPSIVIQNVTISSAQLSSNSSQTIEMVKSSLVPVNGTHNEVMLVSQEESPENETATSWISLPGLSTILMSTETLDNSIVAYTTEYYTTEINGFTAHYSRSTSNLLGTIEQTSTTATTSKPSIHFPTPVRFLFGNMQSSMVGTNPVADDNRSYNEHNKIPRKYKELYDDINHGHDYYDEPFTPSSGHMPRSRTIREKDSQPLVEFDYDVDYADNSEQPNLQENSKLAQSFHSTYTPTLNTYTNHRPMQMTTKSNNNYGYSNSRRYSGFGQRVGKQANNNNNHANSNNLNNNNFRVPVDDSMYTSSVTQRSRTNLNRAMTRRRQISRTPAITATRSLDYYNFNDYVSIKPSSTVVDNVPESRIVSDNYLRNRQPPNRALNNRRRMHFHTTSVATTTTPAPRNYALLPNQRIGLNRKYNRNRAYSASNNNVRVQTPSHERGESYNDRVRHRGHHRQRSFSHSLHSRLSPSHEMYQMHATSSEVYATPTIPKVPITVTSIITTVKTVPIFHGYRTSYATLTTTSLNTSIIPQSLYETSVNEDGMTQTIFTTITDSIEPSKVTEILITTSVLHEVKLVPIKFGYSTRTETSTDIKTFTMLTTMILTKSLAFQLPAPAGSSLLTTVTTFVTTQTVSSTTAVSLLLHGKTLVSTLTFTSLSEATVTKTETLTVAAPLASQVQPQPIVTLLTLSITGDNGEVTELVTAITVPVQQMQHTKVERDVKPTSTFDQHRIQNHRPQFKPRISLESSGSPHNNYLSASFKTVDQYSETHPFFITTIFKGPNTEIYEASATIVDNKDVDNIFEESRPMVFHKRKLQQYSDNLYKESNRLNGERNKPQANNPRTNQRKPSFQRVRIKQSRPTQNPRVELDKTPSESNLQEFNRLVGIPEAPQSAMTTSATTASYRRVPISREPSLNLYSSVPVASASTSAILANNFQKPTFRRIKPQFPNNRRLVSSIRTIHPTIVSSVIQPSQPLVPRHTQSANFFEIVKDANINQATPNAAPLNYPTYSNNFQTDSLPLVRPINRIAEAQRNRNQFNTNFDSDEFYDSNRNKNNNEFNNNDIGLSKSSNGQNEFYPTRASQADTSVHTPTIPLTYYTTVTYLTTVIRGQHTAHVSRESVTSTVITRALDKSIVEVVRDNDGIIEPTKVIDLGTRTKGVTTTVYNAVSQVQIYNEDLYNVIQKTYNKNINFKPWKPSAAIYQPIFVTNSEQNPTYPLNEFDSVGLHSVQINPSQIGNDLASEYSALHDISPSRVENAHFASIRPSVHSRFTPIIKSSLESSFDLNNGAERTPIIDESTLTLLSSSVQSKPSRISSSIMIRKPINSKYNYLYPRSRVRVRVKSSNLAPKNDLTLTESTDDLVVIPSATYESPQVDSIAHLGAASVSSPYRIKTTKSKIFIRHRNQQNVPLMSTLNSNFIRMSSRVLQPSATLDLASSYVTEPMMDSSTYLDSETLAPVIKTSKDTDVYLDSIDHSDAARANKFVRVSNGVTLIMSSKVVSRPFTLEPTLVTGGAVLMKNLFEPSELMSDSTPSHTSTPELKKQYTTYTYHTTFLQGDKSYVSSSLETVTNTIFPTLEETASPIRPSTTTETLQFIRTSTLYSTLTYYATLFNGTSSSITPIEDVKTEYITFPDKTVVTRTIDPTPIRSLTPDQSITQTYYTTYTNLATFYSNSKPVVSTIEEVVSSEVTMPKYSTVPPSTVQPSFDLKPLTLTRSTHTTLTHFITLFSGTHTILSSIEEISPTVVTEVVGQSSTAQNAERINAMNIRFTQQSVDLVKQSKNLFGGLVPSISTLFTTHTYYTTLFSGTTSIIQSRKETTHSLITLYVPNSATIKPSEHHLGMSTAPSQIEPTRIESSSRIAASPPMISYIPESVIESTSVFEPSSASTVNADQSAPSSDTTGVVYFTNFILPSRVSEYENTIDQAKGPVNEISPLMNHGELTVTDNFISTKSVSTSYGQLRPSATSQGTEALPSQINGIKPGSIIELSDLLDGANIAGNIGEAIKDIVQILAKSQKNQTKNSDIDRTSSVREMMPPKDGVTVSQDMDNPVYIPMHETTSLVSSSVPSQSSMPTFEMPPVTYVPVMNSELPSDQLEPGTYQIAPSFIFPTSSVGQSASTPMESQISAVFSSDLTSWMHPEMKSEPSTRFITSVESSPSTVTLSTTKVYYTRDSPLTITSEYISTLAPATIISTIIGSKTIINTYSAEINPTKSTLLPQSTVGIAKVLGKVELGRPSFRPSRKPGTGKFKPPSRTTSSPKMFKTSHRPRVPYKPSPTMPPEVPFDYNGQDSNTKKATKPMLPKTTTRPSILDIDQCKPGCNAANKEICKEFDGKFKCDCRAGYVKKSTSDICYELQNFIVLVRVTKMGESEVTWESTLTNQTSDQYKMLSKAALSQLDSAYASNSVKNNYIGSDVINMDKTLDGNGVLVNMTIHLTESGNLDEELLKEELTKNFEKTSESLPNPEQIYADLEDVLDFDECSSDEYNDCAASARCINEPGSYRCECLNGYPDLDISFPGRMCASEIKACEFCYGRGDCFRDETGQISSCKCHRMYLGRRCEINGLLLAIFIPVLAILCIISICSVAYCCRKWKNRNLAKGFRNFSAYGPNMIGSTLDRKAMLETSSDNSDPLRSHISYDGPGIAPAEATLPRDFRRRRESDHSERSLGSLHAAAAAQYNFSPQFMIPRVRNTTVTQSISPNSHYHHQSQPQREHHHHHHQPQQHHGRGHNHRHSSYGSNNISTSHHNLHSHNGHGHSQHHHHGGSSYDLHYSSDHGTNHRSNPYAW